jgi:hypothetical protein
MTEQARYIIARAFPYFERRLDVLEERITVAQAEADTAPIMLKLHRRVRTVFNKQ